MAVQAQHRAPVLLPLPNLTVGVVENQLMNGLNFKKRSRNNFETEFSQQYEALTDVFTAQHQSRVYGSVSTSTSGRTTAALTVGGLDLSSQLYQQGLEIEALASFQIERMRNELEFVSKRHCVDLQSVLGQRIKDKEAELERASRRHAELEQKAGQIAAESQIWFNVAKTYESLVWSLSSTLEQALLQNTASSAPDGESGDCVEALFPADYAESCCYDGLEEARRRRTACRVCGEKEVCVLILPCRHLCLCKDCESSLDSCPVCHTTKNASIQILLS